MIRFVKQHGSAEIREHQKAVIASLMDADISIRKRALELLYVMTGMALQPGWYRCLSSPLPLTSSLSLPRRFERRGNGSRAVCDPGDG